ncbi:MAG: DUF1684 domain-containing protein, partial [Flammeovirgaceae bacterium]|nr:DUF1684 domain-containing protein [Flammeovirgaceae bacterium]MDW8287433.1 DUF1684 domain-containing protein [Flammeovirgaceae bacterium]
MKRKSEKLFFVGVLTVVILVIVYAFSSHQSQEDYLQQLKEYREKKDKMFRTSDESPLDKKDKKQFKQLDYFEPDLSYRVEATIERIAVKETIKVNTSTNVSRTYLKYAKLKFTLQGTACELLVLKPIRGLDNPSSSTLLFLPFTDETSGVETYGAGRYLDVEEPKGDKLI